MNLSRAAITAGAANRRGSNVRKDTGQATTSRRRTRAAVGKGATLRPLWQCPKCGHRFVTAHMWHSCRVVDLDEHFRGKRASIRALFDAWREYVEQFGEFTVLPQKTRICFQTRVRFAGAIIRRDWVQCTFWLKRRHKKPPAMFEPVEFIPPRYFVYRFRLTEVRQLRTRGLRGLMRESYELGWQREPGRKAGAA